MKAESAKWGDLRVRVASAVVMLAVGGSAVYYGGLALFALVAVSAALMAWEIARMALDDNGSEPVLIGILSAISILSASVMQTSLGWLVFLVVPLVLLVRAKKIRFMSAAYAFAMQLAVFQILFMREQQGLVMLVWLVLVIIASDVLGYFVGRMVGGPKFWPAISPKKTWSGTVAGWLGAGLVGLAFVVGQGASPIIIFLSMVTAFAGQLGDIAESALKRRTGIKDSSNLIPGHGGMLDRFDALIGAAFFLLVFDFVIGSGAF